MRAAAGRRSRAMIGMGRAQENGSRPSRPSRRRPRRQVGQVDGERLHLAKGRPAGRCQRLAALGDPAEQIRARPSCGEVLGLPGGEMGQRDADAERVSEGEHGDGREYRVEVLAGGDDLGLNAEHPAGRHWMTAGQRRGGRPFHAVKGEAVGVRPFPLVAVGPIGEEGESEAFVDEGGTDLVGPAGVDEPSGRRRHVGRGKCRELNIPAERPGGGSCHGSSDLHRPERPCLADGWARPGPGAPEGPERSEGPRSGCGEKDRTARDREAARPRRLTRWISGVYRADLRPGRSSLMKSRISSLLWPG